MDRKNENRQGIGGFRDSSGENGANVRPIVVRPVLVQVRAVRIEVAEVEHIAVGRRLSFLSDAVRVFIRSSRLFTKWRKVRIVLVQCVRTPSIKFTCTSARQAESLGERGVCSALHYPIYITIPCSCVKIWRCRDPERVAAQFSIQYSRLRIHAGENGANVRPIAVRPDHAQERADRSEVAEGEQIAVGRRRF